MVADQSESILTSDSKLNLIRYLCSAEPEAEAKERIRCRIYAVDLKSPERVCKAPKG